MSKSKQNNQDIEFIGKALFFPKQRILAIGDLHLGYEYMLRESGSMIPQIQMKQTFDELKEILEQISLRKIKLNKIIFLGDIKHYFGFNKGEKNIFLELLSIIENYAKKENIIIIKGNHEKLNEFADKNLHNYYIYENIAFIHGDKYYNKVFDKKIKTIVMGHLHPAVTITDKQKIRAEKYKCFLTGDFKGKNVFILPSFFPLIEGTSVNEYLSDRACIIPAGYLKNFDVIAIGQNNNHYNFGRLKSVK